MDDNLKGIYQTVTDRFMLKFVDGRWMAEDDEAMLEMVKELTKLNTLTFDDYIFGVCRELKLYWIKEWEKKNKRG